jgi:two-component system chemotaxis sensor kinase CheA
MELMYLPGISTASQVTDNSGRGVGMDIVRNNIQRINGTLLVESEPNKGTIIRIILPLTLAIVSSLMTRIAGTIFAIPLVMVTETLRVSRDSLQSVLGRPVTLSRGALLPLVDVANTFNYAEKENKSPDVWIVVVWSGRQQFGLVVDELIGKEEVVIKSLGALVGEVKGLSGAAILGDGEIALILDVPGLLRSAGIA